MCDGVLRGPWSDADPRRVNEEVGALDLKGATPVPVSGVPAKGGSGSKTTKTSSTSNDDSKNPPMSRRDWATCPKFGTHEARHHEVALKYLSARRSGSCLACPCWGEIINGQHCFNQFFVGLLVVELLLDRVERNTFLYNFIKRNISSRDPIRNTLEVSCRLFNLFNHLRSSASLWLIRFKKWDIVNRTK